MASSLVVPIAVWHNLPNLETTCLISRWPHVFAGQNDGSIWVFSLARANDSNVQLSYKLLLLGHSTRVVSMCLAKTETDSISRTDDVLISGSEDGQIIRWNAADGRCLAVNAQGFFGIPHSLHVRSNVTNDEPHKYVFCCGLENEITIMDANTLKIVRVWGGHEDWVTCTMFHETGSTTIRLMTIINGGKLAIWDFEKDTKVISKCHKYDNLKVSGLEGSIVKLLNDPNQPSLFLALSTKTALLFTIGKSNIETHVLIPAEDGSQFSDAVILDHELLSIQTVEGDVYIYKVCPPEGVPSGEIVTRDAQLYYSAYLVEKFAKSNIDTSLRCLSTLCQASNNDSIRNEVIQISFCNDVAQSSFLIRSITFKEENNETVADAKVCAEATCESIWPLAPKKPKSTFGSITTTINISDKLFAIGFDSGTIILLPMALALMHLASLDLLLQDEYRNRYQIIEHAHNGRVTCLYAPDQKVFGNSHLISGGQDGAVKIWGVDDGKLVATFTVHALPVKEFIEPAEQVGPRLRGCIISIAMDNSVTLISIEEINCLYIIPGYPYAVKCIQWRHTEDYLIIAYQDDTAVVWQLQTAHLDRKLIGSTAVNVLSDGRWPMSQVKNTINDVPTTFKQTATTFSVSSGNNRNKTTSFIQVFAINLRHLVNSIRSDARSALQSNSGTHSGTVNNGLIPGDQALMDLVVDDVQAVDWHAAKDPDCAQLYTAIVSALMSWGIEEKLDQTCIDRLGLERLSPEVTIGLRGVEGKFSFLIPSKDESSFWKISPILTASRLMMIVTLLRSMLSISGLEDLSSELMTHYTTLLPEKIGPGYCFPSFLFLSKYWQDTSARALFASALCQMNEDEKKAVIEYWESYLPTSCDIESVGPQVMARATIILAIIGSNNSEALSPETRKVTALSLTILLSDTEHEVDNKENEQQQGNLSQAATARLTASMELLAEGFSTWESYIKSAEVLRTIFAYTGDRHSTSPQINRTARAAIFQIANNHMPLVVGTLTYDMMNSQKMEDRLACMRVVNMFARKRPQLLFSSVSRVVEAVVKTLDPNVPNVREHVIQSATSILHDLVRTYPFVDFNSATQKLAVGTQEGASIVYDLRTATRCLVLEGHTRSVIALAFSPDAKWVITCSLQESQVYIWHANPGIFGMLASSISSVTGTAKKSTERRGSTNSSQKPYKSFGFALPNPEDANMTPAQQLRDVEFVWATNRNVKLRIHELVMRFNV